MASHADSQKTPTPLAQVPGWPCAQRQQPPSQLYCLFCSQSPVVLRDCRWIEICFHVPHLQQGRNTPKYNCSAQSRLAFPRWCCFLNTKRHDYGNNGELSCGQTLKRYFKQSVINIKSEHYDSQEREIRADPVTNSQLEPGVGFKAGLEQAFRATPGSKDTSERTDAPLTWGPGCDGVVWWGASCGDPGQTVLAFQLGSIGCADFPFHPSKFSFALHGPIEVFCMALAMQWSWGQAQYAFRRLL